MPNVAYPQAAYEKAIEMAEQLANAEPLMEDLYTAETGGFFAGLRCCLPSEAVGLLVMVHDDALEHFQEAKPLAATLAGASQKPKESTCPKTS